MAIAGLYEIFNHWHKQGTVWLISDTHFNDPELKANINRPDPDEMVKMINSKVGKNDTLIHLGDVGDLEYMKKIRGYKVLIAGNHDTGLSAYKREIRSFCISDYEDSDQVLASMKKKNPNCICKVVKEGEYQKTVYIDNQLFDEVYSGALFIGEKLILSHEPIDLPYIFNIHGHIHNPSHKNDKNHFNVCGDGRENYYPINFNQWMKEGHLSGIQSIHRQTIDKATKRKKNHIKNKKEK